MGGCRGLGMPSGMAVHCSRGPCLGTWLIHGKSPQRVLETALLLLPLDLSRALQSISSSEGGKKTLLNMSYLCRWGFTLNPGHCGCVSTGSHNPMVMHMVPSVRFCLPFLLCYLKFVNKPGKSRIDLPVPFPRNLISSLLRCKDPSSVGWADTCNLRCFGL